jgi:hypothetical protein
MGFLTVHVDARAVASATKLGKDIAARLLEMQIDFKRSPVPNGLDYEAYNGSRDAKFRTARINDGYRALIWEIDTQTVFIYDVGDHNQARRDSKRLLCRVDPVSRDLRILEVMDGEERGVAASQPERQALIPPGVSDDALRKIGLTDDEILLGRSLVDAVALSALINLSPNSENAALAMQLLSEGVPPDDVYQQVITLPPQRPELDDFGGALQYTLRRQKLTVLSTEQELKAALEAPWDNWKTWLHPTQREIAYKKSYRGPFRVTGGPGTGKTIVALHRVRALLDQAGLLALTHPILLTTFSTTMVDQLQQLLHELLPADQHRHVVVQGLDSVVREQLRQAEHPALRHTVLNNAAVLARITQVAQETGGALDGRWLAAFWERVLLAMPEHTPDAYAKLRQSVRSVPPLTPEKFHAAANAAANLEKLLEAQGETTFLLRARDATGLTLAPRFSHVVVDEAQDCHPLHWRLLRQLVASGPNDIFLVFDSDQRIYRGPYPLSQCGIDIRGRSRRLTASYRCSKAILDFAYRLLGANGGEDPDAEQPPKRAVALMSGMEPVAAGARTADEELERLVPVLERWHTDGIAWGEMLVSCCTKNQVTDVVGRLGVAGIPAEAVDGRTGATANRVLVMTMHRSKGMEARAAVIFGASSRMWNPDPNDPSDVQLRRLALFVAATRARERLYVSWHVEPSPLLQPALS